MAATKTKTTKTTTKTAQPTKEERPPLWKVWFVASRPHTLTASISPNIVAYHAGVALFERAASGDAHAHAHANVPVPVPVPWFSSYEYGWLTLKWTAFCMLMQLGTNLHNDYADFVKGADNEKRVGQARATQKGWLTPFQTAAASGGTLLLGLLLGLGFVADLATGQSASPLPSPSPLRVWGMLLMVLSSIFNAFAYTGGPWPLGYIGMPNLSTGYSGLGDACVFLYFGLLATLMPPWLYTACHSGNHNNNNNNISNNINISNINDNNINDNININININNNSVVDVVWPLVPHAVQVAVLATNIIAVNNLRDRHTDVLANKRTLAVRFGATFCRVEYGVNLAVAYGLVLWKAVLAYDNGNGNNNDNGNENENENENGNGNGNGNSVWWWWWLLPLLSSPLAWKEWRALYRKEGGALNPHVGGAAKVQLLFCILLAISARKGSPR